MLQWCSPVWMFRQTQTTMTSPSRLLVVVKVLSQSHIIVGIVMLAVAVLADLMSSSVNTVRLSGLEECCSFYFLITGVVGVAGVSSSRRGLIGAFILMSLHAAAIFVPGIIITSAFDIHFFKNNCYGECDWHLLAPSMPDHSRCQILCGESISFNQRGKMMRLGTDYRIDACLITGALVELIISILTVIFAARYLCVSSSCARIATNKDAELVPLNQQQPLQQAAKSGEAEPSG